MLLKKRGTFGASEREAAVARRERFEKFARAFADALRASKQCGGSEAEQAQCVIDVTR